ncbi:hypothetical protein SKAU_G00387270 [Synaphobranchus kaupii]|uniref:Zinc finger CCHC domain-containing protein n=1 Tax=Synaphobranchus kaupii TaxID=118154 RepID=A0A9Q1ICF4_SYNKA|nr:hypothetical protein SKAU_G00387270 [Synaphobranchus kaupii]
MSWLLASSAYVPTGETAMTKFMAGKGDGIKRAAAVPPKNRHAIRVEGLKGVRRKVVSPVLKPVRRAEDPPAEKIVAGPSNLTEGGDEAGEDFFERRRFNREVLLRFFGLKVPEIMCVQRNRPRRFFDVTLRMEDHYKKVEETCRVKPEALELVRWRVQSLWRLNYRVVTVHVFNPFVTVESV